MGLLRRTTGILVTLLLAGFTLQAPAMATVSLDEDDEECLIISRSAHKQDEAHVDLYISDVSYQNGKFYINGEPYPQAILKHMEKVIGFVEDASFDTINPEKPQRVVNPIVNPIRDHLAGPLISFLEDFDLDYPPIIQMEVRIPAPDEGLDGVRLIVIVNSPVCLG